MTKKPLFALVALGLLLGLAESAARLLPVPKAPPRGIVMPAHPTRGWTLENAAPGAPSHYRATADGLRAPSQPGPDGAPLVLTTGDSSIFGDGCPDGGTIHDLLQAEFNAREVPARVATLAVPGYSTEQTRVVLDEVGWDMEPRLLVVADLWSDSNAEGVRDRELLDAAASVAGRTELLLARSALFFQVRAGLNAARGLPARRKVTWPVLGATGLRRVPLDDYAQNLATILHGARSRGVGVVVLQLANAAILGNTPGEQLWTPYFDVQTRTAEAFGVPVVRAKDAYGGRAASAVLHDGLHPSPAGARLLAVALVGAILDAGWPATVPVPEQGAAVSTGPDRWDQQPLTRPRSAIRDAMESDP